MRTWFFSPERWTGPFARESLDRVAEQRERGVLVAPDGRERDLGIAGRAALVHLHHAALAERAQQLAEGAEPVVGLAERRLLAQDGALEHRRQHGTAAAARQAGERAGHERVEVGLLRRRHAPPAPASSAAGAVFGAAAAALAWSARLAGRFDLDALEPLVEEELVARGGEQRRRRRLDPDADHALVELAELVHERREVAVAGAEHEGGDVVAFEARARPRRRPS